MKTEKIVGFAEVSAVCTDLSAAYTRAVSEHLSNATLCSRPLSCNQADERKTGLVKETVMACGKGRQQA